MPSPIATRCRSGGVETGALNHYSALRVALALEQKTRLRIQATSNVESDGFRLPDRTREAARRDQNKVALWELRLKAQQLARTADDLTEIRCIAMRDLDEGEARNQFAAAHLSQMTVVKDPRRKHNFIVSVLRFVLDIPKGLPWTRCVSCSLMIINK
jgi:hypothetical protein